MCLHIAIITFTYMLFVQLWSGAQKQRLTILQVLKRVASYNNYC